MEERERGQVTRGQKLPGPRGCDGRSEDRISTSRELINYVRVDEHRMAAQGQ